MLFVSLKEHVIPCFAFFKLNILSDFVDKRQFSKIEYIVNSLILFGIYEIPNGAIIAKKASFAFSILNEVVDREYNRFYKKDSVSII